MTEARALPAGLPVSGRRPFLASTIGLVAGKGLQMGGGFLFWVIAARAASPVELGLVAAVVSAVMLCTQLGQMGTGAGVIVSLGTGRNRTAVLDTAFTVVLIAGAAVAAGALVGGSRRRGRPLHCGEHGQLRSTVHALRHRRDDDGLPGPGQRRARPWWQLRGPLRRSGRRHGGRHGGAGSLADRERQPGALRRRFLLGAVAACAVGTVQLRSLLHYSYRPHLHPGKISAPLVACGSNGAPTMIERAPGSLVPILVAHVVSLEATAYLYPAWMMAWVAYSTPVLVGLVQFAEGVKNPGRLARSTRSGLGWSLLVGAGISVVMVVLARPLLHLMGARYADASTGALRLLAIGLVPYAVIQKATTRSAASGPVCARRSPSTRCWGSPWATVTVSVARQGPTAMAAAWLTCLCVGAVVAGLRAIRLVRGVTEVD